tara:strand:+ start:97482 stop:98450 length:969 start_codon:yes stop_codon:yes gene_type:complete
MSESVLNQFKNENKNIFEKKNTQSSTYNLPIKVTDYQGNLIVGTRIDTKEEVKVMLREDVTATDGNEKPTVENFSNPQDFDFYLEPNNPNSIIVFDSAYFDNKDQVWKARWPNIASKPTKKANVLVLNSTLNIVNYEGNKFIAANIIKRKLLVNNIEDLKNNIIKALTPNAPRVTPSAIIRLKDDTNESLTIEIYARKDDNKNFITPQNYIEDIFNNDERLKKISELITQPQITTEVLMASSMNIGGKTNQKLLKSNFFINMVENEYQEKEEKIEDGVEKSTIHKLYKPTVLVVRTREDGSPFIISAKPLLNRETGKRIEDI